MPATAELQSLPTAVKAIPPAGRSRATGLRWLRRYPDLGMTVAGRHYLWRPVVEAIANGTPLDQAAVLGRACRERSAA